MIRRAFGSDDKPTNRADQPQRQIVTSFDYPPIPDRQYDWSATLDSYDGAPDAKGPNSLIGRGRTEAAAVADLMERLEEEQE